MELRSGKVYKIKSSGQTKGYQTKTTQTFVANIKTTKTTGVRRSTRSKMSTKFYDP
jgi:hypothetical protein